MRDQIEAIKKSFNEKIENLKSGDELEKLRVEYQSFKLIQVV